MKNTSSLNNGVRAAIFSIILAVAAVFMTGCSGLPTYASSDPNRPNYMKWQGVNRVTFVNKTDDVIKIYTTAHQEVEQIAERSTVTISVNMDYNEHYGEYAFILRAFPVNDPTKQKGNEIIKTISIANADNGYGYITPRVNSITIRPSDFADGW